MAIKVIIKRIIQKDKFEDVLVLLRKLRIEAMNHPGYISGETLVNHYSPQNITVIASWQTVEDWISWQESDGKRDYEAQLDKLLKESVKYEIYDLGISSKKKEFLI